MLTTVIFQSALQLQGQHEKDKQNIPTTYFGVAEVEASEVSGVRSECDESSVGDV